MNLFFKISRHSLLALLLLCAVRVDAAQVNINGTVATAGGTPVCAMALASGQYMFTCSPVGQFNMNVFTEADGTITLFVFADGFFPYKQILNGGQSNIQVVLTKPGAEPCMAATDIGCATLIRGNWGLHYSIGTTTFDLWYALATIEQDVDGEYYVWGLDEYGELVIGYYAGDDLWVIYDSGPTYDQLHVFETDGELALGCTYLITESSWSDCYEMYGYREPSAARRPHTLQPPAVEPTFVPAATPPDARLVEVYQALKERALAR